MTNLKYDRLVSHELANVEYANARPMLILIFCIAIPMPVQSIKALWTVWADCVVFKTNMLIHF